MRPRQAGTVQKTFAISRAGPGRGPASVQRIAVPTRAATPARSVTRFRFGFMCRASLAASLGIDYHDAAFVDEADALSARRPDRLRIGGAALIRRPAARFGRQIGR